MCDLVKFGLILHRFTTVLGWVFCLVLLAYPQERSLVGLALLLVLTLVQTVAALGLAARLLLGRLDEKEQRMQDTMRRLQGTLGTKANFVFAGGLALMLAFKLALPAAVNQI